MAIFFLKIKSLPYNNSSGSAALCARQIAQEGIYN